MRTKLYKVYKTTKQYNEYKQPILNKELIGTFNLTVTINNVNLTNDIRFKDATHTVITPRSVLLETNYIIEELESNATYEILYKLEEGSIYRSYYASEKTNEV